MVTKKDRRHAEYQTDTFHESIDKQYIIDNCLEPQPYWNDWSFLRDGQRDWYSDGKKIKKINYMCFDSEYLKRRLQFNSKNKRLLKIRHAKKINKINKWRLK